MFPRGLIIAISVGVIAGPIFGILFFEVGIEEQLDQLYWDKKNGTNKWVEAIDKVKSDNPKP